MSLSVWTQGNIGRFENLVEEVKRLFGITLDSKKNASHGRKDWEEYYTNPAVAQKVEEIYKEDFELLGYSKLATNNKTPKDRKEK